MKTFKQFIKENHEHPMIDVDGVMKHKHNSLGQLIHPTDEGIRNFHRWFGDSRITDEHGRPMVMYHATNSDFHTFNPGIRGRIFLHHNPNSAMAGSRAGAGDKIGDRSGESNIMPLYVKASSVSGLGLSISDKQDFDKLPDSYTEDEWNDAVKKQTNPNMHLMYDDEELPDGSFSIKKKPSYPEKPFHKALKSKTDISGRTFSNYYNLSNEQWETEHMKKNGFDATLTNDESGLTTSVLNPNQLKSAIGNNGDFHPHKDKITESK